MSSRKDFVGQYEETLRRWAKIEGLDPDLCVWVESLLNPYNAPWRDLQNMKARVREYIESMSNPKYQNNERKSNSEDHLGVD